MTVTIDSSFVNQYSGNIHLLLEQRTSKTRGIFREEEKRGEKHFFDRLGKFTASKITSRLEPTILQDASHSRRMCTVDTYQSSTSLDSVDKLKLLIDPSSEYSQEVAASLARVFDDVVIDALIGTASTGKDGSGTQALPSGQKIAHGSAGLTAAKIDSALELLQAAEVDLDMTQVFMLLPPSAMTDLIQDSGSKLTSFDFQGDKFFLKDGKGLAYRGVKFIVSNMIPAITAGSVYRAILFTDKAVKIAIGRQLDVKAAERPDLNFALQISSYMAVGAVRMEDEQVVEIAFQ